MHSRPLLCLFSFTLATGGLFHVRTTFGDTISEGEQVAIVEVYRTEGAHQYEAVYVTVESSNNDVVTSEELLVQLYEGESSKTQRIVFNNNEEINEDVTVTATIRMDELVPTSFAEVNPEHQSVSFTVVKNRIQKYSSVITKHITKRMQMRQKLEFINNWWYFSYKWNIDIHLFDIINRRIA